MIGIISACCWHNSAQCQSSITEVSEQDKAQFTHKRKAALSRAEFCKLAHRKLWALLTRNYPPSSGAL